VVRIHHRLPVAPWPERSVTLLYTSHVIDVKELRDALEDIPPWDGNAPTWRATGKQVLLEVWSPLEAPASHTPKQISWAKAISVPPTCTSCLLVSPASRFFFRYAAACL